MAKRIILGALVGMLVSWPVLAADDSVFLHCTGFMENVKKERHGVAKNVWIPRDGSWIMWVGKKWNRTRELQTVGNWVYIFDDPISGKDVEIVFNSTDMSLLQIEDNAVETYACFPIENPFKF